MSPPDTSYTATAMTTAARQRLRGLQALILQFGVPKGITAPLKLTLSETIEIAVAISEREIRKEKRR